MYDLPEPPATTGQADRNTVINQRADQLLAALNGAIEREKQPPTSVRVDDPAVPSWREGSRIGTAPPVPQPGIPPQSRGAVDYAVRVLSTGVASVLFSGGASLVMVASGYANPTVIGLIAGAPIAVAVPIAALGGLARRAKEVAEAAPPQITQTFNGTVHQENHTDQRKAVWQKNIHKG